MAPIMTYDQLIDHFGGLSPAAAALGYDRQRVFGWKGRERIPTDDQIHIEIISGKALLADIPQEIRTAAA